MTEDFTIHEISLTFSHDREELITFLDKHHLAFEEDIEAAFGIFNSEETMVGCGCCAGSLLKCFAVDESLRGQNALGSLVSRLVENRFEAGNYDLFVITRPKNKDMFTACGFYVLAQTDTVLMLENKKNGLDKFYSRFLEKDDSSFTSSQTDGSRAVSGAAHGLISSGETDATRDFVGCIVMNCNPFTKGHLALVSYAAARCDLLHIFVVEENRSAFPFDVRLRLVKEGTAEFPNVRVHPSGPYMISSATFPTYFLKEGEDAARIQSELDIALFASRIAPVLHITTRFAGDEPFDPVTAKYNEAMERILPEYGISFHKIPRVTADAGGKTDFFSETGAVSESDTTAGVGISAGVKHEKSVIISASRVRKLLAEGGVTDEVLELVPPCTARYLKNEFEGLL